MIMAKARAASLHGGPPLPLRSADVANIAAVLRLADRHRDASSCTSTPVGLAAAGARWCLLALAGLPVDQGVVFLMVVPEDAGGL